VGFKQREQKSVSAEAKQTMRLVPCRVYMTLIYGVD